MRLVVDSNILFTFFWSNSILRELSKKQELELFSPEYALEEINRYQKEITKKAQISKKEFKKLLNDLVGVVDFIPLKEYSNFFKKAKDLAQDFSKEQEYEFLKDLDFYALALKLNCLIWSNDLLFKKQQKIYVLNTKEVIDLFSNI